MDRRTSKIVLSSVIALTIIVLAARSALGLPITIVDQENPGPFETTNGANTVFSFVQSFTPSPPAIDAMHILLVCDGLGVVNLLDRVSGFDGLSGNLISQSLPVLIDLLVSHVFHFDFPDRVSLIPGQTYVAELLITTGSLGVRHTQDNVYAGGQFLHQGLSPTVFSNTDLVFAEGLHALHAVNEPTTLALFGIGLAVLCLRRYRP